MTAADVQRAIEAIWRIESPKLIATLARMLHDIGRAEDIAQDAFVSAMTQWPDEGIPRNPGAWLMTAAKRRAIDLLRRETSLERKTGELGAEIASADAGREYAAVYEEIDDDMLRLMFVACHPVLSAEARVALTLRLLGGLSTPEIARAFLVPESTVAQRIVRAKKTLVQAGVPFEVPVGAERTQRLASVLEVLYLIFNEGYAATSGEDVLRPELVEDALRLGRVLAGLAPDEAEVHGLVALMELQASRMRARVGRDGEPILLLDQDRGRWNHLLIQRGLKALGRAYRLCGGEPGPYTLQAAIASEHARAGSAEQTNWPAIAALYGQLARILPSPVVELNRAVAVGMAEGPEHALRIVERLLQEPALRDYHLLPSVHADLLHKLGRSNDAREQFERAALLATNSRDRDLLLRRAQECLN
ncbi:MAG TPA: RNA polymerase sigma factor [Candidatus Baltobacteraceae bacterium]|nr:RNA polymerase sigma factor [Candidatus Baltobacteraceae bacterium]